MSAALIVLNPRAIPECVRSIEALNIPKCWIRYMPELEAAETINRMVAGTDFDRYVLLADDTIPTQAALDAVLRVHDQGAQVATGWCNLDAVLGEANVARNVLPAPPPTVASYEFLSIPEMRDGPAVVETTFVGLCLTVLGRHVLKGHPLRVSDFGGQMDYMLSWDLARSGVRMVAVRDAFVWHVKEQWNLPDTAPRKRLLVYEREPEVFWTGLDLVAA